MSICLSSAPEVDVQQVSTQHWSEAREAGACQQDGYGLWLLLCGALEKGASWLV